jgi:ribosomal protein S18 acetylase RimI-like enzyme
MTKEKQARAESLRLIIRNATADDEPRVTALWRACNLVASYNDPSKDFRFARAKESSDILVGLDAEQTIVGSVMVGHDGHRGWIYYVAADPQHRYQGIGRAMVEAAEQWLKNNDVVKVMLLVRETNTQVIDFYNRLGFEAVPRVVMQKWLEEGRN